VKKLSVFVENFRSIEDVIDSYNAPADALKGAKVYLAWYGYGSCDAYSLIIFKKGEKLYEVNGSHCSCYGLEGQWQPEETSWKALAMRNLVSDVDGSGEAQAILTALVKKHNKEV
jgi:hypothetical protein